MKLLKTYISLPVETGKRRALSLTGYLSLLAVVLLPITVTSTFLDGLTLSNLKIMISQSYFTDIFLAQPIFAYDTITSGIQTKEVRTIILGLIMMGVCLSFYYLCVQFVRSKPTIIKFIILMIITLLYLLLGTGIHSFRYL